MQSDVSSFIIDRKSWSRGRGKKTKLLNDRGEKDCLGFFLLASGFRESQILNLDEPIDVVQKSEWFTKLIDWSGGGYQQSAICHEIVRINDIANLDEPSREKTLIGLFGQIGVKLSFIN